MTRKQKQPLATKTEKELQKEVVSGIKKYKSIRAFRKTKYPKLRPDGRFVVSLGTLSRIAKGNPPKTNKLRNEFRLASTSEVTVCPVHGIVHLGSCKLTFNQKLEFSDMSKEVKDKILEAYEWMSLVEDRRKFNLSFQGNRRWIFNLQLTCEEKSNYHLQDNVLVSIPSF